MALLKTDPIDWALDSDGELDIVNGLPFSSGASGVAQGIRVRIQMYQGEWFADLDRGLPWYQNIIGQKYDPNLIRSAFRNAILEAPGVEQLTDLSVSFNASTREVTVSWAVLTEFGDTLTDSLSEVV